MLPTIRTLAALLGLLWTLGHLPPPAAAQGEDAVREYWYRFETGGAPSGWQMTRREVTSEHRILTQKMHIAQRRLGKVMTVDTEARFVEMLDGRPVSLTLKQVLGQTPAETTWTFTEGGVEVVVRQGGQMTQPVTQPWPNQRWLAPGQAERYLRQKLNQGVEEFFMTTVEPLLGLDLITTLWKRVGDGEVLVVGGEIRRTTRWEVRQARAKQVLSTAHLDADGNLVRYAYPFLGTEATQVLTTRARATNLDPDAMSPDPFTATHIAFDVDALDDLRASMNAISGFLVSGGRLRVEVLEEEY